MTSEVEFLENDWRKMNVTRQAGMLLSWSEEIEWGGVNPTQQRADDYQELYDLLKEAGQVIPFDCFNPEAFGRKVEAARK